MTVDALQALLCAAKLVFSHGASWTETECRERAREIVEAAAQHDQDALLMAAVFIQECDLRDDVARPVFLPADLHRPRRKRRIIGYDYCPMGVRIMGTLDRHRWTRAALFTEAARRMARWERWCKRRHSHTHFIQHYNEGNAAYTESVLAIRRALRSKAPLATTLEPRTAEIVRRLLRPPRVAM